MRGVVVKGDREVEILEFPDPAPGPDDVVIEMKASGLCGSDLTFYRQPPGAALSAFGFGAASQKGMQENPTIIGGHEPSGIVVDVGSNVPDSAFKVGDRVMQFHYKGCGYCRMCRTGWTQLCGEGATLYGATAHGGHADLMLAPASTLVHLPENVSFAAGAAMACGTGTAYGALQRANVTGADTVAIVGMGPIGLSGLQFALAMGCRVIAVDIEAKRLKTAAEFGAHEVIDASQVDSVQAIKDLTNGMGATVALETSGATAARSAAVQSLATWGRIALVGLGGDLAVEAGRDVILRQISVYGNYTFSIVGLEDCARFVSRHQIDVDAVFTDHWSLDNASEAYREFDKQTRGKALFTFN